ncbi:hypothetical protein FACS1894124_2400 [Spirochaetia bacterium]|nr:hypothetical protein FACS1894124_2400 [Spirochaetia bacterium]
MLKISVLLLPVLILGSCVSSPAVAPPPWSGNVNTVYPRGEYIAQKGEGGSKNDAETNALANISRFFASEITASEYSAYSSTSRNGIYDTTRQIDTDTLVQSQTKLFAVNYAEDAWQNPGSKKWETVAYIDRAEAWIIYEPEAQKQAAAFTALFEAAENERDPLKRFFAYRAAERHTVNPAYITTMEFGQILAPLQMNSVFAEVRASAATIPQKLNEAKKAANIFVVVDTDNEGALNAALAKALGSEGFPVAKSRGGAAAICTAAVTEGLQKTDMGTFYFPKISITLRSASGGDVFSFSIEAAKQGAMNPDIAKLRAYTALAAAVEKQFSVELNKE